MKKHTEMIMWRLGSTFLLSSQAVCNLTLGLQDVCWEVWSLQVLSGSITEERARLVKTLMERPGDTGSPLQTNDILGKGAFKTVYKGFDELEGLGKSPHQPLRCNPAECE